MSCVCGEYNIWFKITYLVIVIGRMIRLTSLWLSIYFHSRQYFFVNGYFASKLLELKKNRSYSDEAIEKKGGPDQTEEMEPTTANVGVSEVVRVEDSVNVA